jgi:hypothetical protein
MRSLEKRIRGLEHKFHRAVVILEMPDGTTEKIVVSSGRGLLDLVLQAASEPEAGVGFSRDVDAIRRSIRGTEKGGHMIELARAVLQSPIGTDECDAIG